MSPTFSWSRTEISLGARAHDEPNRLTTRNHSPPSIHGQPDPHLTDGPCTDKQDEALRPRVHELATHCWADPHEAVWTKQVLGALDEEGQLALEYEVDLLLILMRVDASTLAGLEHDEVHAE